MVAQMKFLRRAPEKVERFMRAVVRSVLGSLPLDDAPRAGLARLHSEVSLGRSEKPARHQA